MYKSCFSLPNVTYIMSRICDVCGACTQVTVQSSEEDYPLTAKWPENDSLRTGIKI